jgi:DNA mismatch repair protein MutS2
VARVLAELQAAPTVRKATEAQKQLEAWKATVAQASRAAEAQARAGPEAIPGGALERGARVRIVSLGHEGEVLEVDGDEALVRAGALKIRRPVGDLLPLRGKAPAAPSFGKTRAEKLSAAEAVSAAPVQSGDRRLDARGLRVEELLREVERFLDRLYGEGAPEAVILHGHGTGALKQALRDHLGASPYVASFRGGERHEGGDAVTVVTMRR